MTPGCYFCGLPATSKEHVPPKAFFPASKDLGAKYGELRKNLLTVPSCAVHNNSYSASDERVAYMLAMVSDSPLAADHFASKVVRVFERKPSLINFVREWTPVRIRGAETAVIRLDLECVESLLDKIARALCFHVLGVRFPLERKLTSTSTTWMMPGMAPNPFKAFDSRLKAVPDTERIDGAIGDERVFRYSLFPIAEEAPNFILRLVFYGATSFIVFPHAIVRATHGTRRACPKRVSF